MGRSTMTTTYTGRGGRIRVTFDTYSELFGRHFRHVQAFESMSDFRLHVRALYSGSWAIVSVDEVTQ